MITFTICITTPSQETELTKKPENKPVTKQEDTSEKTASEKNEGKLQNRTKKSEEVNTFKDFDANIQKQKGNSLIETSTQDWGTSRGQGKRVGGMVMGAMSDMKGKKQYSDIIGKLDENERKEVYEIVDQGGLQKIQLLNYAKAREAGYSHETALDYMIKDDFKGGIEEVYKRHLKRKEQPKEVKAAPEKNQEKIVDIGEKIGGARKDVWGGFREKVSGGLSDSDITSLPLSKIFPEPNYQKLAEQGADPLSLAIIKSIRDEVPPKGRSNWKKKQYVEKVKLLRDTAQKILDDPKFAFSIASFA